MKKLSLYFSLLITASLLLNNAFAHIDPALRNKKSNSSEKSQSAGCAPGAGSTYLELNNVRALIHTGGDMWWDLAQAPKYEIPKGSGKMSLYSGAIWIGGEDVNGQLKVTAVKYRTEGTDYYPGPLKTEAAGEDQATVTSDVCLAYDRHFVVTRDEVATYRAWYNATADERQELYPGYTVPVIIDEWPAHGPNGDYDFNLAPFKDVDENGVYDPGSGDYPYFDLDGELPCGTTSDTRIPRLYGDISLWWVYNDKGNIHGESKGDAVGMEIRAQAFAFATNDELNNMTFYNYALLNRSTYTIYNTYFGVWTDADMGNPEDDYVGCDVNRGLGYLYNGDAEDEATTDYTYAYGGPSPLPPAIGMDFFEGPYQDKDGIDNLSSWDADGNLDCNAGYGKVTYEDEDVQLMQSSSVFMNGNINGLNFGDGIVDNERWGMRRFLYFNRGDSPNQEMVDPDKASEFYNYLKGYWKNGSRLTYDGDGFPGHTGVSDVETDFMFPGESDPCGWGQGGIVMEPWDEFTENNDPFDRRFVQSAGPFTLQPGAVNDITVGAVWARATSGTSPYESVKKVLVADDKAQKLFENCFKVVDGPHAPEMDFVELDQSVIFNLWNKPTSNNYLESYMEKDPFIVCPLDQNGDQTDCDPFYKFQGYIVYQLKDASVSSNDLNDPDRARIVFKCDVKDDVDSSLVNYYWDDELKANIPVMEVEIASDDNKGIEHTFEVTKDMFASGTGALVNNREYYYMAIAYAYNNYKTFDPNNPDKLDGQKLPFKAGRKGAEGAIKKYTVIPHKTEPENGGTQLQSSYGQKIAITRLEGMGNGGSELVLTDETHDRIMSGEPWSVTDISYTKEGSPVSVEIIDPLNIKNDTYILAVDSASVFAGSIEASTHYGIIQDSKWYVENSAGKRVYSNQWISYGGYKVIPEWGIAVKMQQVGFALGVGQINSVGEINESNGFISASMEMSDNSQPWLDFVSDIEANHPLNWIRAGSVKDPNNEYYNDVLSLDDKGQIYEKILGGKWAPYVMSADEYWDGFSFNDNGDEQTIHYGHFFKASTINRATHAAFANLSSVDIYITSDKSKWSRCPVVEMSNSPELAVGGAEKFELRRSPSIDKDGNIDTVSTTRKYGMGWFPGYAIDKESGCRLNIMYGENSSLRADNGDDMIFNPTGNINTPLGDVLFGGMHYIYIMAQNIVGKEEMLTAFDHILFPAYDGGAFIYDEFLKPGTEEDNEGKLAQVYSTAAWVSIPITNSSYDFLGSDYKISIDIEKPYRRGINPMEIANPQNDNLPRYSFSTEDYVPIFGDRELAEEALDLIRVVPNPYYGHSQYYEQSPVDYKVKITNLPPKCEVTVFSVNGTIIRNWNKDDNSTYIEWDLENNNGLLIASGIYIVHVEVDGVGEKVIKWMGAMRPVDFGGF